jgi:hypothetical protein
VSADTRRFLQLMAFLVATVSLGVTGHGGVACALLLFAFVIWE